MNHPWLKGVDWDIIEGKLVANDNIPFWPSIGDNFDNDLANKKEDMDMEHYEEYLKKINDSGYFKSFYFNYFNIKQSKKNVLEKTSNSNKNTSNTEGLQTSRSDIENDFNNIILGNVKRNISYIKINTNNLDDNPGQNKDHISTDSNIGKHYKIKANSILSNKCGIYEKKQINKFNRALLFDNDCNFDNFCKNKDNEKNNNNDIKIN